MKAKPLKNLADLTPNGKEEIASPPLEAEPLHRRLEEACCRYLRATSNPCQKNNQLEGLSAPIAQRMARVFPPCGSRRTSTGTFRTNRTKRQIIAPKCSLNRSRGVMAPLAWRANHKLRERKTLNIWTMNTKRLNGCASLGLRVDPGQLEKGDRRVCRSPVKVPTADSICGKR